MKVTGRGYTRGEAEGAALVLREPLSFWGGIDVESGRIIDRAHPDAGASVSGAILCMPGGRGSSSSSSVLAEMMRTGSAPAAIVLTTADPILPVGALVAASLYGKTCPVVVCSIDQIRTGDRVRIYVREDGTADVDVTTHT